MRKYALFRYDKSYNLGDEIQSIAATQFLPIVHATLDRDSHNLDPCLPEDDRFCLIANGWFHSKHSAFPFPKTVTPLFRSFHINDINVDTSRILDHVTYLKNHEPIGCRDLHTCRLLSAKGIKNFFSGCMTLTLHNKFNERTNEILAIDVPLDLFHATIPQAVQAQTIHISQAVKYKLSHAQKMHLAQEHLDRVARAKLVITSRLHTALPCLAFGTPLVFMHENLQDVRFQGWLPFLKTVTTNSAFIPDVFEFAKVTPNAQLATMATKLREDVSRFIGSQHERCLRLTKTITCGNSILACCMNRNDHVQETLGTWLKAKPDQIVLVDWNSRTSLQDFVDTLDANAKKIIKFVRVTNVGEWVLTRAYNLAARLADFDKLLKVDCDTFLDENFFQYHNLIDNVFFAGNWKAAKDANERHTNGIVYVRRNDFFGVGGYNELITTYGYDDCDLYHRLTCSGLRRLLLNLDKTRHLEHSNTQRTANQILTVNKCSGIKIEIEVNRLIAALGVWNASYSFFNVFQTRAQNYFAECMFSSTLNPLVREPLVKKARQHQGCGSCCHAATLYLETQNGLGNRLRALASAIVIARNTRRKLVVIWTTDFHCEAKFGDLFESLADVEVVDRKPALEMGNIKCYDYSRAQEAIDTESVFDIYVKSACVLKNSHTSYAQECTVLKSLRPVELLRKQIETFNDFKHVVGVHCRNGQPGLPAENIERYNPECKASIEKWRARSHWSTFVNHMKLMCQVTPATRFFVCTDSADALLHFKLEMGDKVFSAQKNVYDRSVQQIQSAVVDMWLLARTDVLLASCWSSFSEVAHRLQGKQMLVAGVDF